MTYKSYEYRAKNIDSYKTLAKTAIDTLADVTLFSALRVIVIAPTEDAPDIIEAVGAYIDKCSLDFDIFPLETEDGTLTEDLISNEFADANTLRVAIRRLQDRLTDREDKLITLQNDKDRIEKECAKYSKWFVTESDKREKMKDRIKAISVLIDALAE